MLTAAQAREIESEHRDAQWWELNQRVIDGTRDGDWHAVKFAHFQQALMLFERGADHRRLAEESRRGEIRLHRSRSGLLDTTHVRVVAQKDQACPGCAALHGLTLSFDEALETMPIPCPYCTTWSDKNPNGGWCRCYYEAVIE